jgi:hypothetical protein
VRVITIGKTIPINKKVAIRKSLKVIIAGGIN